MLDTWTDLLKKLPSAHTVVHVGAGRGAEFPLYQRLKAKKVILIEPQADLARQLESVTVGDDFTVINRAVDSEARLRTFYQANNSYFSGFTHPKELQAFFPDLRLESEFTIDTWPLSECLVEHVSTRGNNLLILDTPDLSVELLASLEQQIMGAFRWIVGQYVASDKDDRAINRHSNDSDFWSLTIPGQPPHAFFFIERNPMAGAFAKSEERLRSIEAQLRNAQESRKKLSADLEEERQRNRREQKNLTGEIEALRSELSTLQTENTALKKEAEAQLSAAQQMQEAFDEQKERSSAEQEQHTKEIDSLRSELSTAQADYAALKKEAEAQLSDAQQVQYELSEVRKENDTLKSESDALRITAESLQKEAEEIRAARDELSHRQRLLDDEVLKAEAQLTLIKEVLIRDKI